MKDIYERIKYLCKLRNTDIDSLAKATDIKHDTMRKWKYKNEGLPSTPLLLAIADYLNSSIDYLLGRSNNPDSHFDKERYSKVLESISTSCYKFEKATEEVKKEIHQSLKELNLDS